MGRYVDELHGRYAAESEEEIKSVRSRRIAMNGMIIEGLQEGVEIGKSELKDVIAHDKAMEREAKLLRLYKIEPPDPAGKTLIGAVVAIARRKKG